MKNKTALYASVIALCACFSMSARAGTCNGGVVVEGVQNNHEYCRSSTSMPWWAAFQWCQEQGRHLVTMQEACVDRIGITDDNACPNLKVGDNKWIWTANPHGSCNTCNVFIYYAFATTVDLISGNIGGSFRSSNFGYALCF